MTALDQLGHESPPSDALRGLLDPQAAAAAPPAVTGRTGDGGRSPGQPHLGRGRTGPGLAAAASRSGRRPFRRCARRRRVPWPPITSWTWACRMGRPTGTGCSVLGYDGQAADPVTLGPAGPTTRRRRQPPQGLTTRRIGDNRAARLESGARGRRDRLPCLPRGRGPRVQPRDNVAAGRNEPHRSHRSRSDRRLAGRARWMRPGTKERERDRRGQRPSVPMRNTP